MKAIKERLWNALAWPCWFWAVLKFLAGGLLWDATIPDRPWSVTGKRLRDIVWRMLKRMGLEWRESDPLWPGIKACFKAYAELKETERAMKALERELQPALKVYGKPGETLPQFLERLPQLLELASIGKKALAEKKGTARDG